MNVYLSPGTLAESSDFEVSCIVLVLNPCYFLTRPCFIPLLAGTVLFNPDAFAFTGFIEIQISCEVPGFHFYSELVCIVLFTGEFVRINKIQSWFMKQGRERFISNWF